MKNILLLMAILTMPYKYAMAQDLEIDNGGGADVNVICYAIDVSSGCGTVVGYTTSISSTFPSNLQFGASYSNPIPWDVDPSGCSCTWEWAYAYIVRANCQSGNPGGASGCMMEDEVYVGDGTCYPNPGCFELSNSCPTSPKSVGDPVNTNFTLPTAQFLSITIN